MYVLYLLYILCFRNHVTMVTSEHLNALLRNILNLIKKTVGEDGAPWMVNIAGNVRFYFQHGLLLASKTHKGRGTMAIGQRGQYLA